MKRIFSAQLPLPGHPVGLPGSQAEYLFRTLQLKDGELCVAQDGAGRSMPVIFRHRSAECALLIEAAPSPLGASGWSSLARRPFSLEIGLLKPKGMLKVIAEAVSFGARALHVWLDEKDARAQDGSTLRGLQEKWQHHADQCMSASRRQDRLEVALPKPFAQLLTTQADSRPILWWDAQASSESSVALADWVTRDFQQNEDGARLLIPPDEGWDARSRLALEGCLNQSFPKVIRVRMQAEDHAPSLAAGSAPVASRGLAILAAAATKA